MNCARFPACRCRFKQPFFKEFTLQVPGDVPALLRKLLAAGYHGGLHLGQWYPALGDCLSIAVTEKRTRAELDGFAAAMKGALR